MQTVYAGGLGEGKTLSMVAKAMELKRRNPSLQLYANFPNSIGATILHRWSELEKVKKAIVLIDEGHKVFDSRDFKFNVKKTHFILESRHNDLIVFIATQVLDQIDLRIRRVTNYLILCEKKYDHFGRKYFVNHRLKSSAISSNQWIIQGKDYIRKPQLFYGKYDTKGTITALE